MLRNTDYRVNVMEPSPLELELGVGKNMGMDMILESVRLISGMVIGMDMVLGTASGIGMVMGTGSIMGMTLETATSFPVMNRGNTLETALLISCMIMASEITSLASRMGRALEVALLKSSKSMPSEVTSLTSGTGSAGLATSLGPGMSSGGAVHHVSLWCKLWDGGHPVGLW